MKPKYLNIIIFIAVLIIIGSLNLIKPEEKVYLQEENRMRSKKPEFTKESFFSGEYFKAADDYFADNFIFREIFISIDKKISQFKGVNFGERARIIEYSVANVVNYFDKYDPNEKLEDTEWGKILVYNCKAMEINTFNELAAQNYAKAINLFVSNFPDLNIFSLLVPTQIEFIDEMVYKSLSISQKETIRAVQNKFYDSVIKVDIWEQFFIHRDEYLFFRTDHHWTQRGAFYAYQVFAELIGEKKPLIEDYEKTEYYDFVGSLYSVTNAYELKENPDYIEVFDNKIPHTYKSLQGDILFEGDKILVNSWLDTKDKYGVFMGGDHPLVKVESQQDIKRNILVIKDSYANAFIPFLTEIAGNIIVIDPRLFQGSVNDLIKEHEITDILFINYALITRQDGYGEICSNLLD